MDSVKNICFNYPVIADNTINLWRELQISLRVVLEISKREFFKVHFLVRGSGFGVRGSGFGVLKIYKSEFNIIISTKQNSTLFK
jgi:hypothetical protein